MKRSLGRTSRRRTAVLVAALLPLAAACSSGSDGSSAAEAGTEAGEASGESVDGDVVTRNPSQAEQAEGVDGEPVEQSAEGSGGTGAADPNDGSGTADADSSTSGSGSAGTGTGGASDDATSTGGGEAASTTTTGGGSTGGTTGDSAGASTTGGTTTGGETGGSADGETTTGDPALVDQIPLDQIESIEDSSGLIIADVPTAWIEVDGSPSGEKRALRASPDLAAFTTGFATEGVLLEAIDVPSGTANWQTGLDAAAADATAAGCSLTTEVPYDDGIYIGVERRFDCAAGLDVSVFAGTNEDESTEWLMRLIVSAGDEPTRQLIFQSFLLD